MLAPGKKPFHSLDPPSKDQLPNGDGEHSFIDVDEEHHGKFAHKQPFEVRPKTGCWFK